MENSENLRTFLWSQLFVEFLGTFFLVTVVLLYGSSIYGAFAIGMTLAVAVFFGGYITTGCFNPAVTLGNYLNGSITGTQAWTFMLMQFLAAVAAYYFYRYHKIRGIKPHIDAH